MSGHCRPLFESSRIMGSYFTNKNCSVFAVAITKSFTNTLTKSHTTSLTIITLNEQILIIALIAVVVALSIVLLIYRRHRKTTNLKQWTFPTVRDTHPLIIFCCQEILPNPIKKVDLNQSRDFFGDS